MKSTNNDIAAMNSGTGNRRKLLKAMAGTPLLAGILGQSAFAKPQSHGQKPSCWYMARGTAGGAGATYARCSKSRAIACSRPH
jgi:hypothetical protein